MIIFLNYQKLSLKTFFSVPFPCLSISLDRIMYLYRTFEIMFQACLLCKDNQFPLCIPGVCIVCFVCILFYFILPESTLQLAKTHSLEPWFLKWGLGTSRGPRSIARGSVIFVLFCFVTLVEITTQHHQNLLYLLLISLSYYPV